MTKHISIADAKASFSSCVKQAEAGEEVVITRHGRPVAAVVSVAELQRLRRRSAGDEKGGLLKLVGLDPDGELTQPLQEVVNLRGQTRTTPNFE